MIFQTKKAGIAGVFVVISAIGGAAAAQEACSSAPIGETPFDCLCAGGDTDGSVWGSNPYTADSSICTAATHAGLNGPKGGLVRVVPLPGEQSYAASSMNGVSTRAWGAYNRSFTFEVVSGATDPEGPVCGAYPVGTPDYSCTCGPFDGTGSVWGSGPYTADSDLCLAAIHSGAIGPDGGAITAFGLAGLDSYRGSVANGVTTRDWGSYGQSFVINAN